MKVNNMLEVIKQIIRTLISLFPVNNKIWIFGAWRGQLFADNSKFMFEYVNEIDPQIESVWITKNKKTVQYVRGLGYKVYTSFSLWGIWTIARAGICFQTEGDQDISPFMNKKTKVIQLWHGVAPKKANWNFFNSKADRKKSSFWMASSDQNKVILQELFGMPENNVYVTGYPRNDCFTMSQEKSSVIAELDEQFPNCKKVIYMPTHRNFGTEGTAFSEIELLELDKKLRISKIVLVFKPHFHELKNYIHLEDRFTNIVLAKDVEKYQDVYSYINGFDALISDYSSIIYDFLCSKKPIILFPYDLEHFRNLDAGLFDYFEGVPAGPFCYTWDQVVEQTVLLLSADHEWNEKREKCRLMFHPNDDGKNRERVYKTVLKIQKER